MRNVLLILIMSFAYISCASNSTNVKNADYSANLTEIRKTPAVTKENAAEILKKYTLGFTIPNPLLGDSGFNSRRFDPNHESELFCKAILLDNISTEADIFQSCCKDSLNEDSFKKFRDEYIENNVKPETFRIRIDMESGFSAKSMDAEKWAIYIENTKGVQIEPQQIVETEVAAAQDSVKAYRGRPYIQKNVMRKEMTLYFKTKTFFGEDLLAPENPYIMLVISQKRKIVARLGWRLSETGKK